MLQLSLNFAKKSSYKEDFIVSHPNEEAFRLISSWPNWFYRILAVHGSKLSGKTYLSNIWAKHTGGVIIGEDEFTNITPMELINISPFIAIEFASLEFDEEWLFHMINLVNEYKGNLLITAAEPPSRWPVTLLDLWSRLRGVVSVELKEPDEETLYALVMKSFADRDLKVKPETVNYAISRLPRSYEAALNLVEQLDRIGLEQKREISIPLAREVLHEIA